MQEIFQIAHQITVMRDGCVVATSRAQHTNMQTIINQMVGRELSTQPPRKSRRTDRTLLRVKGLCNAKLHGISFELNAGEVLGIAGLVGAGRSELGAALFGLDPVTGGTIELNGKPFEPRNVRQAVSRGMGLVPEDRKGQGLMMQMSVQENCTMSVLPRLAARGFLKAGDEQATARAVLDRTRTKTASYQVPVSSLSGGNQQKVLLGRWLQVDPDVLFLDDPTRGIDVGAKRDIYAIIDELAGRGKGLLFVSSELPELLANCDRILVMHDGHVTGCVDAASATQEQVMALATQSEFAC
jgi:ABC-type sugar transport system ATPase subunit